MLLLSLMPRKGNDDYSYRVLFSVLRDDKEHRPHHSLGEDLDEICQSKYHKLGVDAESFPVKKNRMCVM